MPRKEPRITVCIEYKDDKKAKERLIKFLINGLLEGDLFKEDCQKDVRPV